MSENEGCSMWVTFSRSTFTLMHDIGVCLLVTWRLLREILSARQISLDQGPAYHLRYLEDSVSRYVVRKTCFL